jgi:sortase (surface protein transpeptidase)
VTAGGLPARASGSARWWWAAAGLVVLGGGLLAVGLHGGDHALPAPAPSPAAVRAAAHPAVREAPAAVALQTLRSDPVALRIPALGVFVPVGSLGLNLDGTVQVPSTSQQTGWFRLGPTPGQLGSAVILGHVDSYQGPGVFFNLRTLAAGDQLDVALADGTVAQFTVNAVVQYTKTQFPAQRVYGSNGSSALQLVTCGGAFDHQTGSYLSNIVVYSSLTKVIPAGTPVPGSTTTTG